MRFASPANRRRFLVWPSRSLRSLASSIAASASDRPAAPSPTSPTSSRPTPTSAAAPAASTIPPARCPRVTPSKSIATTAKAGARSARRKAASVWRLRINCASSTAAPPRSPPPASSPASAAASASNATPCRCCSNAAKRCNSLEPPTPGEPWVKIAPPAGEFRWIARGDCRARRRWKAAPLDPRIGFQAQVVRRAWESPRKLRPARWQ